MIYSILDNDLYKFSTSWAYMKLYPEAEGTFSFTDRNNTVYEDEFVTKLQQEFVDDWNDCDWLEEYKSSAESALMDIIAGN